MNIPRPNRVIAFFCYAGCMISLFAADDPAATAIFAVAALWFLRDHCLRYDAWEAQQRGRPLPRNVSRETP